MTDNEIEKQNQQDQIIPHAFSDLKRRVEITKDARFQANLRLERRQKWSHFAISMLSLFVIILSLLPNIFELNDRNGQALLALTIVNSVFVIITTFLEASGNFVHKGEQLRLSARQVHNVFSKLQLLSQDEREKRTKIQELMEEYQKILDDCPFNHDDLDYDLVKFDKPSLFPGRIYSGLGESFVRCGRYVKYKISEYSWLIPHTVVVLVSVTTVYWITWKGGFAP